MTKQEPQDDSSHSQPLKKKTKMVSNRTGPIQIEFPEISNLDPQKKLPFKPQDRQQSK